MVNNIPQSLMHALCPQNTVVVERWWKVPLSKVGSPPRLHPRRHRIYKLVEDIKHAPKEKMELILTQTVPSEWLQEDHRNLRRVHCCMYICSIKMSVFFLWDRARRTRRHCVCEKVHRQKQAAAWRSGSVSIAREQTDLWRGVKGVYLIYTLSFCNISTNL